MVCVWVSVCPAPRVLPLRATERPTEGTYGLGASWKTLLIWRFLRFVQKLWRENANKLTATSYGADGATFRQKFRRQGLFWFFQSLTAGYKLPGRVRQRATSLSAVQGFAFVVFRILSVTCSLTRALSQSLAHAQQLPNISAEGLHFKL